MRIRAALHKRLLIGAVVVGLSAAGAAGFDLRAANAAPTSSNTPTMVEVASDTRTPAASDTAVLTPEAKRACLARRGATSGFRVLPVGQNLLTVEPGAGTSSIQRALKECGFRVIKLTGKRS